MNEMQKQLTALSVEEVKQYIMKDIIVLDTRKPQAFAQGFIPGSINIGLDGRFAEWASSLLHLPTSIIIVAEPGEERESAMRLEHIGFTHVIGYAEGGITAWQTTGEPIDMIIEVEADELAMDLPFDENLVVLDVRRPAEFAEGHVKDALNIPLNELTDLVNIANFEEEQNIYIHCDTGYRSVIAASLLKRQGIHNLRNISGGWNEIKKEEKIKKEKERSALN